MLILSRVCAEFRGENGAPIHTVTPAMRLAFHEAPDAIAGDPLFAMLRADRSLEVAGGESRRKQLENDPEAPEAQPEPKPGAKPEAKPKKG